MARIKRRNDVTLLKSRHGFYRSYKTGRRNVVVTRVRGIVPFFLSFPFFSFFFTALVVACFNRRSPSSLDPFPRIKAGLISSRASERARARTRTRKRQLAHSFDRDLYAPISANRYLERFVVPSVERTRFVNPFLYERPGV